MKDIIKSSYSLFSIGPKIFRHWNSFRIGCPDEVIDPPSLLTTGLPKAAHFFAININLLSIIDVLKDRQMKEDFNDNIDT